jgi:hypothetical protein
VLATCQIRSPNEAFENTQSHLLLLADSEEEEYNLKQSPAHLRKGVMYTVHGILTFIKQLTDVCLQSLHHRFVVWTKPGTTSLMLLTLTDQARSKSELVAENALLRQQLVILRRQVKRPTCTKTDRMLLVLLARMVRTWKQAHITRSGRRRSSVGIVRDVSSLGNTSPERLLPNQRFPQRP